MKQMDEKTTEKVIELGAGALADHLRCKIGTSNWGGARYSPMAFTEQGKVFPHQPASVKQAPKNVPFRKSFCYCRTAGPCSPLKVPFIGNS